MKKVTILSLCSLFFFSAFAQSNKPEPNSFGLQYGASYSGTLNQAIVFSGWLKKGIEVRGALGFSFSNFDSKNTDSTSVYRQNQAPLRGLITNENKNAQMTITPTLSVLKHFAIKSNVDVYLGGALSSGFSIVTSPNDYVTETIADQYYHKNTQSTKSPVAVTVGVSAVSGINYFFAKNIAFGIDGGLGLAVAMTNGKQVKTNTIINSGSNNPDHDSQTQTTSDLMTNNYSMSLAGNAGVHLVYYMPVKKAVKTIEQKM